VAIKPTLNKSPGEQMPKGEEVWQLLSSVGEQGPQGPQGPQGAMGPAGPRAGLNFQEFWWRAGVDLQYFVVPKGVTRIQVELWAGGGGGGVAFEEPGGGGAGGGYYRGLLEVTPGETLGVRVGEQGRRAACTNGDYPVGLSSSGGDSWIFGHGEIRVQGGRPGQSGFHVPGPGGNSDGWCDSDSWTGLITAAACRAGEPGSPGGAQGAFVPGGRTPGGSLPPHGFGGGAGGYLGKCHEGQNGNQGSVVITW